MSKKPNAAAFLAAMQGGQPEQDEPPAHAAAAAAPQDPATAEITTLTPVQARAPRAKAKPGRAQLKHFGGYLDDETLEKIALLRVRLKKDNSELIKFAIDELHRKHNAKRAFGDA